MKKKILIIFLWILIWQILTLLIHNSILMAGPIDTVKALLNMAPMPLFRASIAFSTLRIFGGFAVGSCIGMLLGWGAYRLPLLEQFLKPFISVLKAVPVASFVIMLLIWAGNRMLSFYISLLVVLPIIYLMTLSGLRATDPQLLELANIFRMGTLARIRFIYLPSVFANLYGAFQSAIGMAWKSGIAAEVIGQPLGSMGNGLYTAKIYLDTGELFAWTITIVLLSFFMEKLLLMGFRRLIRR
ncbi:MAG: ABC transporter permease subunit [Oribacterium sp.]|nr:ABC transporter permease subunit [Oribacterium sp.]